MKNVLMYRFKFFVDTSICFDDQIITMASSEGGRLRSISQFDLEMLQSGFILFFVFTHKNSGL